jgi:hypothetical protein
MKRAQHAGQTPRLVLPALALGLAGILAAACGDDFEPKSAILGVRVLGVKVETPYAKPATKPKLSMLLVDGSPNRGTRPVNVVWFHGCTNPAGGIFFECYPELSRRLGEAFGGKETTLDRDVPGLVSLGTETVADVPADALGRPAQPGSIQQGRVFVFFVACGGRVTYHPAPPNSSGLPVRCVDPVTNADLPADEFVYGYTPIFVFDALTNAHPVIEGATFGGNPPATVTCEAGCPANHECAGNRCLPVVPLCTKNLEDDCPAVEFKPNILPVSAEPDPIATALDRKETREALWVEYAAENGRFESGTRVVNDPTGGWKDDYAGKFLTFKASPGEATLYAIVRDSRGGQAFTSLSVIVR